MNITGQICCGCGACAVVCPAACVKIGETSEGFYKAYVENTACIECGRCVSVCAMRKNAAVIGREPLTAYAAYSQNDHLRGRSSSGGVFTHIAESMIDAGGVVYGAAFSSEMELRHTAACTKDDLASLRGSKYLQSRIGNAYSEIRQKLSDGVPVFFVGTPCQVAALYSVLGTKPPHLLTADLICHGTPAPGLFLAYLRFLERKYDGRIVDYCFRSKEHANARMSYTVKLTLSAGGTEKVVFLDGDEEPYTMRFISSALQCDSCYQCPFACLRRMGDLTLGDYWGYEEAHPELADINGVSLLLVNTEKGCRAIENINGVKLAKTERVHYLKKNKHLIAPPVKHPDRDHIYAEFSDTGFSKRFYNHTFLPEGYRLYILKRRVRSMMK